MMQHGVSQARLAGGLARVLAAALLALALLPGLALAQGLELTNLTLDNRGGNLSAHFGLRAEGLAAVKAALDQGSELGLRCRVDVHRVRTMFFDSRVAGLDFESRLGFDRLAQEYSVELPGGGNPLRGKDLAALLAKAWGAVTLDLGPWKALAPGHEYVLSLDVSLKRLDVPGWIRVAAFFWSWDVLPATHYEQGFRF
ncbi:MAG: DUF4390 domain-containing protein [Thermodesulfobacteriota bacterium]